MKIPTHLLSNDFIAEILDLFKVKTKHQENLLFIEDTYLSELFFDREKRSLEFKSYIYMKEANQSILTYLNFLMKRIDSKIKIKFKLSNRNDLLKKDAILVINKSDLLKEKLDSEISKFNHVLISLKENLNIDKLISKIKNHLENKFISEEDILITRERHRQHLLQCVEHLKNFSDKNDKKDFDKGAEDLRLATRQLGMIVGKVDVEEILGSIFNDFCIGK